MWDIFGVALVGSNVTEWSTSIRAFEVFAGRTSQFEISTFFSRSIRMFGGEIEERRNCGGESLTGRRCYCNRSLGAPFLVDCSKSSQRRWKIDLRKCRAVVVDLSTANCLGYALLMKLWDIGNWLMRKVWRKKAYLRKIFSAFDRLWVLASGCKIQPTKTVRNGGREEKAQR